MIYFTKQEDKIEKYNIEFNEEELIKLQKEIINNCSEITHYEYEGTEEPKATPYLKRTNLIQTKIGTVENNDSLYYPDETLYHYSYDEQEYPYLIKLIDKLLARKSDAIYEIFNPNPNKEKEPVIKRVSNLKKEIDNLKTSELIKSYSKLDKLQKLLQKLEINKNQKSVLEYYPKVQALLTFELIDSIDLSSISRIEEFFEIPFYPKDSTINKNLQRVLKKTN